MNSPERSMDRTALRAQGRRMFDSLARMEADEKVASLARSVYSVVSYLRTGRFEVSQHKVTLALDRADNCVVLSCRGRRSSVLSHVPLRPGAAVTVTCPRCRRTVELGTCVFIRDEYEAEKI